jgi:hypothetical protein
MAEALQPPAESSNGLWHQFGTEIGHFPAFDVVPHAFGRIEIGRVGREPLDLEPIKLTAQEGAHVAAAMRGQAIPDENHRVSAHESFELAEKADQAGGVVTPLASAGEQARLGAVPPESQRGGHRGLIPVIAARAQNRRHAARRPRRPDRGLLGESGFVLEEDPGFPAPSVFFTSGQRWSTQYWTFSAFRSRACCIGFWTLQFKAPRSFQTCPG